MGLFCKSTQAAPGSQLRHPTELGLLQAPCNRRKMSGSLHLQKPVEEHLMQHTAHVIVKLQHQIAVGGFTEPSCQTVAVIVTVMICKEASVLGVMASWLTLHTHIDAG